MSSLSRGQCVQLACMWEASARKAGNVHPGAGFSNLQFPDFLSSAMVIGPVFECAGQQPVGDTVLQAIRTTRTVVRTNTNLGIVLLLAPLAAPEPEELTTENMLNSLSELTVDDSVKVYEAIRLANPGGLKQVREQDVSKAPTLPLQEIMALSAKQDRIAEQYVSGFADILDKALDEFLEGLQGLNCLENAIINCQLNLLARHEDSLIRRKRGHSEAKHVSLMARKVLQSGWPIRKQGQVAFRELDDFLRAEGHERNPGTTADLVTACLFVALRKDKITLPLSMPWSDG